MAAGIVVSHTILVSAPDLDEACHRVKRFFSLTLLVRYEPVVIDREACCRADDPLFMPVLEAGLTANRTFLAEQLAELKAAGFNSLDALLEMERGYASKVLHTATHILDGFIGIDSVFYNLEEDSHWLSSELRQRLNSAPEGYWLVRAECRLAGPAGDPFGSLRSPANR